MQIKNKYILFAISLAIYIIIDSSYLWITQNYHHQLLGAINNQPIHFGINQIIAGMIAWTLQVLGMIVFVAPLFTGKKLAVAAAQGALYGLIISGVFQCTNLVVIANWPLALLNTDIPWNIAANSILAMIVHCMTHNNK